MTKQNWENVIDGIQNFMIWFLIAIISICILALILFDVLVGAGVMLYLTGNSIPASIFISLATSGLLMALMVLGYSIKDTKNAGVGVVIGLLAFGVYCLDVYFDCLTADYLRYGMIVTLEQADNVQLFFRCLIGGISTVGESLAVAIIVGMPVLKKIIGSALPSVKSSHKPKPNFTKPTHPPTSEFHSRLPKAKKRKF